MAITPWSWTKSNGSASAAQTVAAYNAITSKGYTYSFSRKVWNDLVSKINETAVALGRGWSNEILSLSETKMYWLYSSLSAKMFNSARLNTNYRVWSWSTDETQPGYIGRDDFNGVRWHRKKAAPYPKMLHGEKERNFRTEGFNCLISSFSVTEKVPTGCRKLCRKKPKLSAEFTPVSSGVNHLCHCKGINSR